MSQFKRFNSSDNTNWDTNASYPPGTLTWDPDNGLRLHDGSSSGGSSVGSSNFYDLTNRPTGNTAVHDLQGGSNSAYNGYFLKQTSTGVSEWSALPTTYDTLTIDTKIIGGIDGAAGTQITGIEASLGSGMPYQYAFLSGNDAFNNWFGRGSDIVGWKIYPANDPSAFVTVTEFLANNLGAPSLGFDGALQQGPWIAESSDYNAGTPGPLTLSADTKNWVLGTDGNLTLPAGGDILDSNGDSVLGGSGGGTTLPPDAAGVLKNDGTGTLSWSSLDIQDLTDNGNLLNFTQTQADWEEMNAASSAYIQNKPTLVTSYYQLNDLPTLFNGDYLSLTGTPSLANVATTGEYGDLINTPTSLSNFTNDPGFISASDLAVSSGGSGSLSYSNGLFTYEGPTVPTDISELTDNTNLLSSGGTSLPTDAAGYLHNDGSGSLSWTQNTAGAGSNSFSDVWVTSTKASSFWADYTLTGDMIILFNYGGGSVSNITLTNQAVSGKQFSVGQKVLIINDAASLNSNDYGIVVEFPSSPSIGDTFSAPVLSPMGETTLGVSQMVSGSTYTIASVGTTTNWGAIGIFSPAVGQQFVYNYGPGYLSGDGTVTGMGAVGPTKLIFKPASGQRALSFNQGANGALTEFGQGASAAFSYLDLSSGMGQQPVTWVYGGIVDSIPTWYQIWG